MADTENIDEDFANDIVSIIEGLQRENTNGRDIVIMTAKTKQLTNINFEKIIEKAISKALNTAVLCGIEKGKTENKNLYAKTETRLYAYRDLIDNIQKYNKDIEDLKKEEPGRSKDIVRFSIRSSGIRLSAEEIQEARILSVQTKIARDQAEIDELDFALQVIKSDKYYSVVEMKYFKGKKDEEISEVVYCDASTVRRNRKRLMRKIMTKLYGAQVVN